MSIEQKIKILQEFTENKEQKFKDFVVKNQNEIYKSINNFPTRENILRFMLLVHQNYLDYDFKIIKSYFVVK